MTVKIMNFRNSSLSEPYDVRVDRASILGNPYALNRTCTRDESCDQYHKYFHLNKRAMLAFAVELERLENILREHGQIRLFCWCTPLRCHAETIKQYLEEQEDAEKYR